MSRWSSEIIFSSLKLAQCSRRSTLQVWWKIVPNGSSGKKVKKEGNVNNIDSSSSRKVTLCQCFEFLEVSYPGVVNLLL